MATVGYARVSTLEQNLETQLAELRAAGCDTIHEEKASGAKADRPVLKKVLNQLQKGDTLVVSRLDRLARSLAHLLDVATRLQARGIGFRSLRDPVDTTTPHGVFQMQIMGAMAELERRLCRERTLAGLANARAKGRIGGNPKLRTPEGGREVGEQRRQAYIARVTADIDTWLPLVAQARKGRQTWAQTTATVNASQPKHIEHWSEETLRRAVGRMVDAGMADAELLKPGKRTKPREPATVAAIPIVALLMKTNPGITLMGIAKHLETLGMRPARGGKTWGPSSVMAMRDQAIASGLIDLRETVRAVNGGGFSYA